MRFEIATAEIFNSGRDSRKNANALPLQLLEH